MRVINMTTCCKNTKRYQILVVVANLKRMMYSIGSYFRRSDIILQLAGKNYIYSVFSLHSSIQYPPTSFPHCNINAKYTLFV